MIFVRRARCGKCLLVVLRFLYVTTIGVLFFVVQLSGCAEVRKNLGYEKTVPDAFLIMSRMPLEVPETFDLLALTKGTASTAQRKLAQNTENQSAQILMGSPLPEWSGEDKSTRTPALQDFWHMAGADSGWSDIRVIVDHEAFTTRLKRRCIIDRLIFWREILPEVGPKIDMGKELRRLQERERLFVN